MLTFTPTRTEASSMEVRQETTYGRAEARYFRSPVPGEWLASVSFYIGDVYIHRSSPFALHLTTEAAAIAWCEAALLDGPMFIVPVVEHYFLAGVDDGN